MELILQGWLCHNYEDNIAISQSKDSYCATGLSESIMDYFNYEKVDIGLGKKVTIIKNANLRCWFSDEQCTLEEAQMNFYAYMITGDLLTQGHYTGYSEWTIIDFVVENLIIGGHDLNRELEGHIGQYVHLILTD